MIYYFLLINAGRIPEDPSEDDTFYIQNLKTGEYLTYTSGYNKEVMLFTKEYYKAKPFKVQEVNSGGESVIFLADKNLPRGDIVLDMDRANGKIIAWSVHRSENQRFTIKYVGNGIYKLEIMGGCATYDSSFGGIYINKKKCDKSMEDTNFKFKFIFLNQAIDEGYDDISGKRNPLYNDRRGRNGPDGYDDGYETDMYEPTYGSRRPRKGPVLNEECYQDCKYQNRDRNLYDNRRNPYPSYNRSQRDFEKYDRPSKKYNPYDDDYDDDFDSSDSFIPRKNLSRSVNKIMNEYDSLRPDRRAERSIRKFNNDYGSNKKQRYYDYDDDEESSYDDRFGRRSGYGPPRRQTLAFKGPGDRDSLLKSIEKNADLSKYLSKESVYKDPICTDEIKAKLKEISEIMPLNLNI